MEEKNKQENLINKILSDKAIRKTLTRQSHYWFFHTFLAHYVEYETALFQKEMFKLTENEYHKLIVLMAFRGSGKSTIMNLSYTLWSILGIQQKKFVLIISKSQNQAKNHFQNIRRELETNELLKNDLGPFTAESDNWGMHSLEIHRLGAKIYSFSREQNIRGIKYGSHRPDLIICDDLEDSVSVKTKLDRQATFKWFTTEAIPMLDNEARIIVLGNLLHKKSILMRLKENIEKGSLPGIFKAYPLLDDFGKILWPGKFPTKKEIENLRNNTLEDSVWQKEYLLRIIEKLGDSPVILKENEMLMIDDAINKIYGPSKETNEIKKQLKKYTQISLGKYRIRTPIIIEGYTKIMSEMGYRKFKKWLRGF